MKKRKTNKLVGKIGWCSANTLGLDKGHYVFIRSVYGNKCSVNTFTSIKQKDGLYDLGKIKKIERGSLYPIPKKDSTLHRFSGIHKNVITNVPLDEVENIGRFFLKRRHHHYIQRHMRK